MIQNYITLKENERALVSITVSGYNRQDVESLHLSLGQESEGGTDFSDNFLKVLIKMSTRTANYKSKKEKKV